MPFAYTSTSPVFPTMKNRKLRQLEAEVRLTRRLGRSPMQQLQLLDARPGQAKRERARLTPPETPTKLSKAERKALRNS